MEIVIFEIRFFEMHFGENDEYEHGSWGFAKFDDIYKLYRCVYK